MPGSDPLFSPYFFLATVLNFVPVLLAEPVRLEVSVVGAVHLIFVGRVIAARRASGRQRALDLERFRTAQAGRHPDPNSTSLEPRNTPVPDRRSARYFCASAMASSSARSVPRHESVVSNDSVAA